MYAWASDIFKMDTKSGWDDSLLVYWAIAFSQSWVFFIHPLVFLLCSLMVMVRSCLSSVHIALHSALNSTDTQESRKYNEDFESKTKFSASVTFSTENNEAKLGQAADGTNLQAALLIQIVGSVYCWLLSVMSQIATKKDVAALAFKVETLRGAVGGVCFKGLTLQTLHYIFPEFWANKLKISQQLQFSV